MLTIGLAVSVFLMPAFYAAVLVLLENLFGRSVLVHAAVFTVFIMAFLYAMYLFMKNDLYRDDHTKKDDDN